MTVRLLLAAPLAIALSACAADRDMTNSDMQARAGSANMSGDAAAMPTNASAYVSMAAASDTYEIESSRLALEKSRTATVREFAEMMITHHTGTTQTLMAAARSARMTPPAPMLMPMQRAMIDELRPLTGEAFDRAYFAQQRRAHAMALALHRNYAQDGDNAALRQTASAAVPIIQQHIARLDRMN